MSSLSKKLAILIFIVITAIWFGTLDSRKLVKPDEGRYAEIAREMAMSGDWLTPRLNGIKYFEKPPLQYWATALAFKSFGVNEWTARLWTALTGFLTVLLIAWAGRRLYGTEAGLYAAMVLVSSLYFIGLGHVSTLDMGLTFFTTIALVAFTCAQRDRASDKERLWGMLATWAAMALAVLSKGLVGVVLPTATLVLYTIIAKDWAILRRLYPIRGLLVFLAIATPWFVTVSIKNPEFAWFFFIHEHFLRYATSGARREGAWHYFLPILLAGMLPWTVLMVESLWTALRGAYRSKDGTDKAALIPLIWTLFIFVFFSISKSKLPTYILPIFPSLALLIGRRLTQLEARDLTVRLLPIGVIVLIGFFFLLNAGDRASNPVSRPLYEEYGHWLQGAAVVLLLSMAYACWQSRQRQKYATLTGLALGGFLAGHIALVGYETMSPTNSAYDLAVKIRPYVHPDKPFYSVRMYDQTLPFYLNRTMTLVDYWDEFSYGIEHEPNLVIHRMEDFKARWADEREAFALMNEETYSSLREAGYAMEIIANDGRRIVVRKPKDMR